MNISHHNVVGAENAEREIQQFLQREVARKVRPFLGAYAPALVNVRLLHPIEDHIDVGFELFEQADPEMRQLVRKFAPDIKAHLLEGKEPQHTSLVGKAIAKVPRRPVTTPRGGLRLLAEPTCLQAEENTIVAILGVFFSIWGLSQRGVAIAARAGQKLAAQSGFAHVIDTLIETPIKGVVLFLGSIWTTGGWSVITLAMKESLSTWQYISMGIQILAQVASWVATGWYSFLAMVVKLAASGVNLGLAAKEQKRICGNRRLEGLANDGINALGRALPSHTSTSTTNMMHFSDVQITIGPIPELAARRLVRVFKRVPGHVEEDTTKKLKVLPSIKLLQDGPIEVRVSHPGVVEATCESEVCIAGFELDRTKAGITCGHRDRCTPFDDTERCCKVARAGLNVAAPEQQLVTFSLSLENFNYDNVMSQGSTRVDQVKNSIKSGVVAGSGNLVTTAAVNISLSKELSASRRLGISASMRSSVTVDVSSMRHPETLLSAITSDGSYNVGHGVVNSLMSLSFFDDLRTGMAFVDAMMTEAPELFEGPMPPHRRLQDILV